LATRPLNLAGPLSRLSSGLSSSTPLAPTPPGADLRSWGIKRNAEGQSPSARPMGGTGEAKLARDAWTLPNPHAPRSSPQSLFVKEGFQGVADADSQTSGSVPLYHPGAYPLCQRGTEGDFGESRDTHHPKASLRPHPRHPPEADCPSAHRERAISASCERERARNTSNNPKGRVPQACPWVSTNPWQ